MRAYGGMLLPVDILYPYISAVDGNQSSSSHRFTIYDSARSVPLARIHNWSQKEMSLSPLLRNYIKFNFNMLKGKNVSSDEQGNKVLLIYIWGIFL